MADAIIVMQQVRANQESVPKICLMRAGEACCRLYALGGRSDKDNSKLQTRCSSISVSFMYPHALLSSSKLFGPVWHLS